MKNIKFRKSSFLLVILVFATLIPLLSFSSAISAPKIVDKPIRDYIPHDSANITDYTLPIFDSYIFGWYSTNPEAFQKTENRDDYWNWIEDDKYSKVTAKHVNDYGWFMIFDDYLFDSIFDPDQATMVNIEINLRAKTSAFSGYYGGWINLQIYNFYTNTMEHLIDFVNDDEFHDYTLDESDLEDSYLSHYLSPENRVVLRVVGASSGLNFGIFFGFPPSATILFDVLTIEVGYMLP